MKVLYDKSYFDDFDKITDTKVVDQAENTVEKLKIADSLRNVTNIKRMNGYSGYYRIRFRNFRIGFRVVDENTIVLLAIDNRSKFYRDFPEKFA